jgi:hypothetical protein
MAGSGRAGSGRTGSVGFGCCTVGADCTADADCTAGTDCTADFDMDMMGSDKKPPRVAEALDSTLTL